MYGPTANRFRKSCEKVFSEAPVQSDKPSPDMYTNVHNDVKYLLLEELPAGKAENLVERLRSFMIQTTGFDT